VWAQKDLPLVQFEDLVYIGAFKGPNADTTARLTLNYSQGALAFNPKSTTNPDVPSLFISCHKDIPQSNVGEISIPTPVISKTSNLNELPTATIIQHCADVQNGTPTRIVHAQGGIGGLLVSGSTLYASAYEGYPAGSLCSQGSHVIRPILKLNEANAQGPYKISNTAGGDCFVNGPMTWLPPEWRPLFGDKSAVAYQSSTSIITSTSWGPAAFAFNPDDLGSTPASSLALMYYTSDHATLGRWNGPDPLVFAPPWNNSWNNAGDHGYRGLVIPNDTRSALYFHAQGIGKYCYGDADVCGDPVGQYRGDHAYPYRFHIMAFDMNNWADVAAGKKKPWETTPYAVWPLVPSVLPFTTGDRDQQGGGAVYDPATKRIYWVQPRANQALPIIHVWEVKVAKTPVQASSHLFGSENAIKVFQKLHSTVYTIELVDEKQATLNSPALRVYSSQGKLIADLSARLPGPLIEWNASAVPNGIYSIIYHTGSRSVSKRITVK